MRRARKCTRMGDVLMFYGVGGVIRALGVPGAACLVRFFVQRLSDRMEPADPEITVDPAICNFDKVKDENIQSTAPLGRAIVHFG